LNTLPLNAFTVDVEDYYQVSGFEASVSRDRWPDHASRIMGNTHRLLDLLAEYNVRGTFFVLGWVAQRFPRLVMEIAEAGHEIASHGYWHRLVYELQPAEFREDLVRSRQVLEDLAGTPVNAFRAASFSITNRSMWALDILAEEGFQYDSSIFPIYHDRYGVPDGKREIHRIDTTSGSLWEFPPSVIRRFGVNLPMAGGGYFRLYPIEFTVRCLRRLNRQGRRPFVFYVHPWEVDPDQPRMKAGSSMSRYRHYLNLRKTERKLRRLLQEFRFGTLSESIASTLTPEPALA
jgi:polysaccharide deacetylase family protein (PEP-CTERM system associated)